MDRFDCSDIEFWHQMQPILLCPNQHNRLLNRVQCHTRHPQIDTEHARIQFHVVLRPIEHGMGKGIIRNSMKRIGIR